MRKTKILRCFVILSNILLIYLFIKMIILQTEKSYSGYWLSYLIFISSMTFYINHWGKLGLNSDINKSSIIERAFSDHSTTLLVFYTLGYFIIEFFNTIGINQNNLHIAIGFFIYTGLYETFTMCMIYGTKKDTAKLLKEQHSK